MGWNVDDLRNKTETQEGNGWTAAKTNHPEAIQAWTLKQQSKTKQEMMTPFDGTKIYDHSAAQVSAFPSQLKPHSTRQRKTNESWQYVNTGRKAAQTKQTPALRGQPTQGEGTDANTGG